MKKFYLAMTGIGFILCSGSVLAQDATRGAEAYGVCAECHGANGEGNQEVGAPKLAGQKSWYLGRQIKNFRDRIRGGRTADTSGHTMSEVASSLMSDEDIRNLLAYIETLPAIPASRSVDGDASRGEQLYSTCAQCHGAEAEGDPVAAAPALSGLDDWYLLAQLGKFKNGVRGTDMDDIHGQEMAATTTALSDEQAMKDVIAYIRTLGGD